MLAPSAHVDTFTRDNLPPADAWPPLVFDPAVFGGLDTPASDHRQGGRRTALNF